MILHSKQKEIVASNARFKVVRAGRRSGKTTTLIEIMLFIAMGANDRNILYTAPTQKQARDIIWEALKKRVGNLGDFNEARLELRVPTQEGGESIIYIAGWENRENFRGKKAHLQVFDELDTMRNFFIGFQEIYRPALTDTGGDAIFVGTPKKENPNLKRLEKMAETDNDYKIFTFRTEDNPYIPKLEIEKARKEYDPATFRQEFEAEYVESVGSLYRYTSLIDVFSNSISKNGEKYLIVDVAGGGGDSTIFSRWEGLEEQEQDEYKGLSTEMVINKIKEKANQYSIPHSHIVIDAIGIGEGVANSSRLDGCIAYKGSYGAIKTEGSIVSLPNVHYLKEAPMVTDYANLRSQCMFKLAEYVNTHKIASKVDGLAKEEIIEELSIYQDVSKGDGKRMVTQKDDVKALIGRSPDRSDTWQMRMYIEIVEKISPHSSPERQSAVDEQLWMLRQKKNAMMNRSTR